MSQPLPSSSVRSELGTAASEVRASNAELRLAAAEARLQLAVLRRQEGERHQEIVRRLDALSAELADFRAEYQRDHPARDS